MKSINLLLSMSIIAASLLSSQSGFAMITKPQVTTAVQGALISNCRVRVESTDTRTFGELCDGGPLGVITPFIQQDIQRWFISYRSYLNNMAELEASNSDGVRVKKDFSEISVKDFIAFANKNVEGLDAF